ncbi:MAG: FecR domain-containing protein [Lewinellaceae bacterium]|nr:FecR domain-containing protein [Saprospiraceae bacterium]MCB9342074.1 FecR domain-containing protein [Lewinellaceae bacterium]
MKENEYNLLIIKNLSGELTPAETKEYDAWLHESPENQSIAREFALVWEQSGTYQKVFTPNLDRDFAKVLSKIDGTETQVLRVRFINKKLLRVAAAIALLLMAVWGYSTFGGGNYYDSVISADNSGNQHLSLTDGTQIWLREGSTLSYASDLSSKDLRRVKLSGEAYFEVAHDPAHPFRVELAEGGSVQVLGTQFNVRYSPSETQVLVKEGRVRYSPDGKIQSPELTAGQQALFDSASGVMKVTNAATLNALSWKTGALEFVNTPLAQVILDLEKYYSIKISMLNQGMTNCPYSAIIRDQSAKQVLDALALTYQFQLQSKTAGEYVLRGGVCR